MCQRMTPRKGEDKATRQVYKQVSGWAGMRQERPGESWLSGIDTDSRQSSGGLEKMLEERGAGVPACEIWGAVCSTGTENPEESPRGNLRLGQGAEAEVKTKEPTSELDRQVTAGSEESHFGML